MNEATRHSHLSSDRKVRGVPMQWHRDWSRDRKGETQFDGHRCLSPVAWRRLSHRVETPHLIKDPSIRLCWNSGNMHRSLRKRRMVLIICSIILSFTASAQTFHAPALEGKTLSGIPADSAFTTGKLTILSFFYIGCMPCMKEIPVLNRLKDHFEGRPVQIVAVAPHTARQLREWNVKELTALYKTEPIRYAVLPECADSLDKPGFSPICYTLSRRFGVNAYPTSVFIGPTGELLMNVEGFPLRDNQDETLQELIRMVEGFLEKR